LIPWVTEEFELDLLKRDDLIPKLEKINQMMEEIDKQDPWIKERFGLTGTGEGLVWYPVSGTSKSDKEGTGVDWNEFKKIVFKTKGVSHAVVKQKSIILDPQKIASVDEFVEMFVTEGRLQQGWQEVCGSVVSNNKLSTSSGGSVSGEQMGKLIAEFVKWVSKDVEKESKSEIKESGLQWSDLSNAINLKARKYFSEEMRKVDIDQEIKKD